MANDDEYSQQAHADFVSGRLHGAGVVLLALANTHPDPGALLTEIEKVEQAAQAHVEATLLSEDYLNGMRDIIDRVRTLLCQRLGISPNPDNR